MKIRWREHEMLFVTILTVSKILLSLSVLYNPSYEQLGSYISSIFEKNGFPFDYMRNVLLPQIATVLLVYIIYILINRIIVPAARSIAFLKTRRFFSIKSVGVLLLVIFVSYLFSIGTSTISYYAKPHLINYAGYGMLALLGYNDMPLENLFFGFDRAILFVTAAVAVAGARELVIGAIDKPGTRREFRVWVINSMTLLLCICLLIPVFTEPSHGRFMDYLAWALPIMSLYIYNTFWLFPSNEGHIWSRRRFVVSLLASTFAGAFFSAIVFSGSHRPLQFFIYWTFLALIVTPLNWLWYQQKKDRILQLKGLETALVKSNTTLQLLRSQINPHFLFNSLNALYGIALKEKSRQTAEGIQTLGDMMRFMLHENTLDSISINKEIRYLKSYISLQKLRIPASPDIQIEDNIDIDINCNETIAPMLLIPFVENAFKHGIRPDEKSWITVMLECRQGFICFEVRNSIHSQLANDEEEDHSGGIGLKNVSERLKLLYPGKHEMKTGASGNEFIAKLLIHKK